MTARAPLRPRRRQTATALPPPPHGRRSPAALVLSIALVLLATLSPAAGEGAAGWDGCVVCGERGGADALLNLALFAPLGAALARRGVRPAAALALACALSAAVELAQLVVPGRDPSPPDLLFNALGTLAGYPAGTRIGRLLRPAPRAAGRLALGWSTLFAAAVAATGWLAAAAPPAGPYTGQWTPRTAGFPLLPARVLDARIGAVPLPHGPLEPGGEVRAALREGAPVEVRWIAGWRIPGPAPLLRVVGGGREEAAALFVQDEDLVFVQRTRAARLRLNRPALRGSGVLRGVEPGDTLTLELRRDGRAAAFANDTGWRARDGIGPGRGWALLLGTLEMRPATPRRLDALWIFLWTVPLGFWLRRRPASLSAIAAAVLALGVLPAAAALAPAGPGEFSGAAGGLLAGFAARLLVRGSRDRAGRETASRGAGGAGGGPPPGLRHLR